MQAQRSALCTVQAARAVDGRGGGERVHTQMDVEALLEQVERRLLHTHVRLDADQDKVGHLLVLREPRLAACVSMIASGAFRTLGADRADSGSRTRYLYLQLGLMHTMNAPSRCLSETYRSSPLFSLWLLGIQAKCVQGAGRNVCQQKSVRSDRCKE